MDERAVDPTVIGKKDGALHFLITDIRRHGSQKAIDLVWVTDGIADIRGDGAKQVEDQINLPLDATDEEILASAHQRRDQLQAERDKPGIGISVDEDPMTETALIGYTE